MFFNYTFPYYKLSHGLVENSEFFYRIGFDKPHLDKVSTLSMLAIRQDRYLASFILKSYVRGFIKFYEYFYIS